MPAGDSMLRLLGWSAALALWGLVRVVLAEDFAGQPFLDDAVAVRLSARSTDDYGVVLTLCDKAISEGLSTDDRSFAEQLFTGALVEQARTLVESAERGSVGGEEWHALRDAAIQKLLDVLARDGGVGEAHLLIARAESLPGGNRVRGREACDRATSLLGDDRRKQGMVHMVRGGLEDDPRSQIREFDSAVALLPTEPLVRRARGLHLVATGDYRRAHQDLTIALAAASSDAQLQEAVGLACLMQHRYAEAVTALDRAVELAPVSAGPVAKRAEAYAGLGRMDRALVDADTCVRLSNRAAEMLVLRAKVLRMAGELRRAGDDLDSVLEMREDDGEILRLKSEVAEAVGDVDSALQAARKRVSINPGDDDAALALAELFVRSGRYRDALARFTRVIEDDEGNHAARAGRGYAAMVLGEHSIAFEDLSRAHHGHPSDAVVAINLAWLLATSPEDAIRDGRRAVAIATQVCDVAHEEDWRTLSTLAAAHAESGNYREATRVMRLALSLCPDGGSDGRLQMDAYEAGKPWRDNRGHEGVTALEPEIAR